jgi:hypothetical protein
MTIDLHITVIPAKAGTQLHFGKESWTPAFAGVTEIKWYKN